jgi:dihydroneopterin aldolase
MKDQILIQGLEISGWIGVPDAERAIAQRMTVNLVLEPISGLSGLGDAIENTIDYFLVCEEVQALSLRGGRCLIETLAEEIAGLLMSRYALSSVEVEVRKYILPQTEFVAVKIRRER